MSLNAPRKNLAPSSLLSAIRDLYTLIRYPLSCLFSRVNNSTSLTFSLYDRSFSPLIIFVALQRACSCLLTSFVLGSPVLDTSLQVGFHQCWAKWRDHLSQTTDSTVPHPAQETLGLLCHKGSLLAHVQPESLGPFIQGCFPAGQPAACTGVWGYSTLGAGLTTPVGLLLQTCRVLLDGNTTIWCVSHSSQFCISCKIAKGVLCPFV